MSEEESTVVENEVVEQQPVKEIVYITDPQERLLALQEIEVLTKAINTTFYMPKWDKGNNGRQQPKITGSVELNYFGNKQLEIWGTRICDLTERLGK